MILKRLLRMEYIGKEIYYTNKHNKKRLKANVIDETKNTFIIVIGKKRKRILKEEIIVEVPLKGKLFKIDGKKLIGRPEERVKR